MSTCRRWACSTPSVPTPISLVAVIAVTSVAANLSTIVAGLAVFEDRLGISAPVISVHLAAFALILVGAAMIPAPARAGEALGEAAVQPAAPPQSRPEPNDRSTETPHSATRSR